MGSASEPGLLRAVGPAVGGAERTIGALLVDAGLVSMRDAERVLKYQQTHNVRFGEAAIRLRLISEEELRQALAAQHDYPVLRSRDGRVAGEVIAAYRPWSREVEQLRLVRSQLMLRWCNADSKALAIVSPSRGEGRSYLASNLAVVFSQLGERTLLIDADMRSPKQHMLLGVENKAGLSTILAGRGDESVLTEVAKLKGLSLLPAGPVPPNPLELLARPAFTSLLRSVISRFDMVVFDTPPAKECADAQCIAAKVGAALMLARKDCTRMGDLDKLSATLLAVGSRVVGVVLNDT